MLAWTLKPVQVFDFKRIQKMESKNFQTLKGNLLNITEMGEIISKIPKNC